MADSYVITLPVIKSASFSVNPVTTGGTTVITVVVEEETRTLYPEARYSGEFISGE
jgi:hypothetical protein